MADLVLVDLDGRLSALDAPDYATLYGAVADAYGHLVANPKTHEVGVCFEWRGMTLDVKSTQTLATFKALCKAGQTEQVDGVPVLRIVLAEKVTCIPTLDQVEETLSRAASRPGSRAGSRSASRNRNESSAYVDDDEEVEAAPPVEARKKAAPPISAAALQSATKSGGGGGPRKATAPVEPVDDGVPVVDSPPRRQHIDDDESGPSPSRSEIARSTSPDNVWIGSGAPAASGRPNSAVARELLQSFRQPSPPPQPMIRALMRDGSASALIPFDPSKLPAASTMRRDAWARFGEALEDKVAELRGTAEGKAAEQSLGRPLVAGQFLLAFWFEGCDLPVDIEDESDVELLGRAVDRFGADNVNVYVDVPFIDVRPIVPNPITNSIPATSPKGLQVNQTRTAGRR